MLGFRQRPFRRGFQGGRSRLLLVVVVVVVVVVTGRQVVVMPKGSLVQAEPWGMNGREDVPRLTSSSSSTLLRCRRLSSCTSTASLDAEYKATKTIRYMYKLVLVTAHRQTIRAYGKVFLCSIDPHSIPLGDAPIDRHTLDSLAIATDPMVFIIQCTSAVQASGLTWASPLSVSLSALPFASGTSIL
jgi:hypothetical protein